MKTISVRLMALALALAPFVTGCSTDPEAVETPLDGTLKSNAITMGNGKAWSWIKTDASGAATELGVTFTEAALQGLDAGDQEFVLMMPKKDTTQLTIFNHARINWAPNGHPPAVWGVPHFDFHFFLADTTTINSIPVPPVQDSTATPSNFYPAGYVTDSLAIPRMGVHYAKLTDMMGSEFHQSFVYGFLKGRLVFLEPMVAKSVFTSKITTTLPIDQPNSFAVPGMYPTKYTIKFDSVLKEYSVSLGSLFKRQ